MQHLHPDLTPHPSPLRLLLPDVLPCPARLAFPPHLAPRPSPLAPRPSPLASPSPIFHLLHHLPPTFHTFHRVHQFDFKTPSERGCELTYVNTAGRRPLQPEHAALVGGGRVPTTEETEAMAQEQGKQQSSQS